MRARILVLHPNLSQVLRMVLSIDLLFNKYLLVNNL